MRAKGGVRRRLSGGCHESAQGRRKSGEIRHPWGVPRQNPSLSGSLAAAVLSGCRESTRGRPGAGGALSPSSGLAAGSVPLGHSHSSRPAGLSWEPARETGIGRNPSPLGCLAAESVSLGGLRGSSSAGCRESVRGRPGAGGGHRPRAVSRQGRHPWAAARQPARRGATRASEGDGNQPESVTLGMSRGKIRLPRRLPRQPPSPAFRYHVAHED